MSEEICRHCRGKGTWLDTTYDRCGAETQCEECLGTGKQVESRRQLFKALTAANATITELRDELTGVRSNRQAWQKQAELKQGQYDLLTAELAHFRHDYAALHSAIQMQNRSYAAELEEVKRERDEAIASEKTVTKNAIHVLTANCGKPHFQDLPSFVDFVKAGGAQCAMCLQKERDAALADLATARKELETERAAREGSQGAVELLRRELAEAREERQKFEDNWNLTTGMLQKSSEIVEDWKSKHSSLLTCAQGLAKCLTKYQARYHGAEHAQKDWDASAAALADFKSKSGTK